MKYWCAASTPEGKSVAKYRWTYFIGRSRSIHKFGPIHKFVGTHSQCVSNMAPGATSHGVVLVNEMNGVKNGYKNGQTKNGKNGTTTKVSVN